MVRERKKERVTAGFGVSNGVSFGRQKRENFECEIEREREREEGKKVGFLIFQKYYQICCQNPQSMFIMFYNKK